MGTTRKRSDVGEVHGVIRQFPAGRVTTAVVGEAESGDRSATSPTGRALHRAIGIVDQSPEVRRARVAELREQLLKGAYTPDPREVAREIMQRGL